MSLNNLLNRFKSGNRRYAYLLLFLGFGVLLMTFSSEGTPVQSERINTDETTIYSIENEEKRLEEILSKVKGVGECDVLLSVHAGAERILAEDEGETVVISESGKQSTVTVQTRYPAFQGAVIVCGGCSDPSVRYDILSSVMSYTGLGVDRITICPINE